MKKQTILQENIFTTIAKMFAALQIERKVGDAIKQLPDDPEVKESLKGMAQASKDAIKILKDYCRVNPNDPQCKDQNK